jgi:hypothetical protein
MITANAVMPLSQHLAVMSPLLVLIHTRVEFIRRIITRVTKTALIQMNQSIFEDQTHDLLLSYESSVNAHFSD